MARQYFVGGNFKMNGTLKSLLEIVDNLKKNELDSNAQVVIAAPAIYLAELSKIVPKQVEVSAQNVYSKNSGAFTGEIAPVQLKDINVHWTLTGHSERRTLFRENDEDVAARTQGALNEGISVILCVGETLEEREKGVTKDVVNRQLEAVKKTVGDDWSKIVIAYEPVWAIGTGKVATPAQAQDAHADIRAWLKSALSDKAADETRVIYGGSVTHTNAEELAAQPDIDGFLVGGASLKPEFVQIINARKNIAARK